jgi:hypothetical protein
LVRRGEDGGEAEYNGAERRRPESIRDVNELRRFENEFSRNYHLSHTRELAILDGLWAEGKALGVLPPKDPMSGIGVDIRVARILNSCSKGSLPD